ncbi:transposable element Tcb2 transposase [Trichonephila clavipes]|nr:transposable element Tcb2 transposase [Trichonephila clavipes]
MIYIQCVVSMSATSQRSHLTESEARRDLSWRIFIWRERGTRNNHAFMLESVKFGDMTIMVNAVISINGSTNLHIIQIGALTGCQYRDEILRPIVVPYAAANENDVMLMELQLQAT